jgi:hypothetical protein
MHAAFKLAEWLERNRPLEYVFFVTSVAAPAHAWLCVNGRPDLAALLVRAPDRAEVSSLLGAAVFALLFVSVLVPPSRYLWLTAIMFTRVASYRVLAGRGPSSAERQREQRANNVVDADRLRSWGVERNNGAAVGVADRHQQEQRDEAQKIDRLSRRAFGFLVSLAFAALVDPTQAAAAFAWSTPSALLMWTVRAMVLITVVSALYLSGVTSAKQLIASTKLSLPGLGAAIPGIHRAAPTRSSSSPVGDGGTVPV